MMILNRQLSVDGKQDGGYRAFAIGRRTQPLGLKHCDRCRLAGSDQLVIERGERQAVPQRQFQIRRIVGGQPMIERQPMHVVEYPRGAFRVGNDPQRLQLGIN